MLQALASPAATGRSAIEVAFRSLVGSLLTGGPGRRLCAPTPLNQNAQRTAGNATQFPRQQFPVISLNSSSNRSRLWALCQSFTKNCASCWLSLGMASHSRTHARCWQILSMYCTCESHRQVQAPCCPCMDNANQCSPSHDTSSSPPTMGNFH